VAILFILGLVSLVVADKFTAVKEVSICGGTMPCSCGDVLVKDYTMTYDLNNCSGEFGLGFRGNGKYITLNCNGHTISGIRKNDSVGLYMNYRNGSTIINCIIENFGDGIFIDGEEVVHVELNAIKYNSNNGILMNAINNKYISQSNITNNKNGIYIDDDTKFAYLGGIWKNNIYNNYEDGIYVLKSSWLNLYNNSIVNNGKYGAETMNPEFTFIQANNFENNFVGNAYEHNGSQTNTWNSTNIGNRWDDFESNPGYPNYYEVPGPGNGIDWYPNKI